MSDDERRDDSGDEDEVAFKPGSITRVRMHNFMTHSNAVLLPKQRLNVVIGANGTGKSTVLNAICLGLGGDPKWLGRADQWHSFIRHGQNSGWVEITLEPHPGEMKHTFKRVLSTDQSAKKGGLCYINDDQVSLKELRETVRSKYNISLDNLCTFLPQDKVGDFSGLTDCERLLETEKTWTGRQCYETHLDLCHAEEQLQSGANQVAAAQQRVERLEQTMQPMLREKDRMQQRELALAKARLYKQKLLWLEFEKLRCECLVLKDEKNRAKVEWKKAQEELRPLEQAVEQAETQVKSFQTQLRTLESDGQRHSKEMKRQLEKISTHDDAIESVISDILALSQAREKKQAEYDKAVERHNRIIELKSEVPNGEDIQAEFDQAVQSAKTTRKDYDVARRESVTIQQEFEELREQAKAAQDRLTNVQDHALQRRQRVLRSDANVAQIVNYLEKHRNEFRHTVHGPIAAELTMKDSMAADYLEFHTPNNILKAFVVECKDDADRLHHVANQVLKVPITVITTNDGRLKPVEPLFSAGKMEQMRRQHGILGYLEDSFTAPDAVTEALRSYAGVHRAVVGNEKTQHAVDRLNLLDTLRQPERSGENPKAYTLFTKAQDRALRFTVKTSRGNFKIVRQDDIMRRAQLLAPGADPQVEQRLERELQEAHQALNDRRPALHEAQEKETSFKNISQEAKVKMEHAKKRHEHYAKLQSKERSSEQNVQDKLEALNEDDGPERERLAKALMSRQAHSISALHAHAESRREYLDAMVESAAITLDRQKAHATKQTVELEFRSKQEEVLGVQNKVLEAQNRFNVAKTKLRAKKEEAEREAPITDDEGNPLPLKEELQALEVDALEDVQAELEEAEALVNSIKENSGIFRQLEELEKKYDSEKEKLSNLTSNKADMLDMINRKKEAWESKVFNNINDISQKFSKYMGEMGCVGEVRLKKAISNEFSNFKDWGIEILVSFRENAKAQILSKHQHSGGERSVATIMYLMALQDLMVSPFRCVDEINQGLDERNERLVFKRIVANSTSYRGEDPDDHSGQYFLITPKLLHDLEGMDADGVEVHTVFNGPYNFREPMDGDLGEYLATLSCKRTVEDAFGDENDENAANGVRRKRRSRVTVGTSQGWAGSP